MRDKQDADEHCPDTGDSVPAPESDSVAKSGVAALVSEVVLLGCGATGLWVLGEHLEAHGFKTMGSMVNLGACIGFFAAVALTVQKFLQKPNLVWAVFGLFSLVVTCIWLFRAAEPGPRTHILLSLRVNNHRPVPLTNDFLFSGRAFFAREASNGPVVFKGIPDGCLVIPVTPMESNMVFTFSAENACELSFDKVQAAIAFPKDWRITADPTWQSVGAFSLYRPAAWVKYPLTNLQCWTFQSSKAWYPWDTVEIPPATNWSISLYEGSQTQGGVVLLQLKAANLDGLFQANIVFFAAAPGFSEPFVARTELTNGLMNVILPSEMRSN